MSAWLGGEVLACGIDDTGSNAAVLFQLFLLLQDFSAESI